MTHIMLQTPLRASDPRPRVEHVLFREWALSSNQPYTLTLGYTAGYPASSTRNRIVQQFLASQCDVLMMLDDDQWPAFNPFGYIDLDKDILGFPYPSLRINDPVNIIPWFPAPMSDAGLQRVNYVGGGMMIIARRVLESIRAPFADVYDADGIFTEGEDLSFCRRAVEAGFEIWCDMSAPLAHVKPAEMLTLWKVAQYGLSKTDT